ncbi:hypothetical protein [Microlunatus parietis]|uniref:Uncharacterized protein n=1 Tax=Microlunatus parietis TaxID=682979 RepID=A0A7Y9LF41_9ACTN|nr:hypothetical protein [Microlunatus parietis]
MLLGRPPLCEILDERVVRFLIRRVTPGVGVQQPGQLHDVVRTGLTDLHHVNSVTTERCSTQAAEVDHELGERGRCIGVINAWQSMISSGTVALWIWLG